MLLRDIETDRIFEVIALDAIPAAEVQVATANTLGGIKPDGQTIVVDANGVAHANLDEIGGDLSDLSARVTALEAQLGG